MDDAANASPPSAPSAERRTASVVKCDVVGSTRIKRGLDLDGQLVFKQAFETVVSRVAHDHSGYVERFEGDGALIMFGYPQAMEDSADAAIHAALELIEAVEAIDDLPGVKLALRVGVASGELAVVTRKWDAKSEPVAGVTIDLAERLRALAEPGHVVVDEGTRRLAGKLFEYSDLGTVSVKGFEEGVPAFGVVRQSSVSSRFEAQRFDESRSQIIGRQDALATLFRAWQAAFAGAGRTVCLVGDAGIGKSRLARATLDRALSNHATVLKIDCTPSTLNTPLFPIGVLLRRTAGIDTTTAKPQRIELASRLLERLLPKEALGRALDYLAPLFGFDRPSKADETPEQVRDQSISTVVDMILALARQGPLALLCEDLHWADATTVTVIERVSQHVTTLRALMIATTRPDAGVQPQLTNATTIALQPLNEDAAIELVRTLSGGSGLSDAAISSIVTRCEGVPLLLEEVTRNAMDAVRGRPVAATAANASDVPAPLAMVVESRLGRRPELMPIAQAASVLGREFSVRLLERMVTQELRTTVPEAIDVLITHGLLSPRSTESVDRARFRHAMIRDAVYNTLLGRDRQRLHSHAADTLVTGYSALPEGSPEVIAEHLRNARRFEEAIRTRLAASAQTAARGAYVESEGHCEAALAIVADVADPLQQRMLKFRLLVQLGVARTGRYGYAAASVESAYREALGACGESAEAEMLYPIIRGLATLNLVRGILGTADELSLQGLRLAEQSGRIDFTIDALSVRCYTTLYYGRLEDCRATIDRCLATYHEHHGESLTYPVPQDAKTAALAILPTVLWLMGDSPGCETAIGDGLAHVERLNRDFDRALMHAWVAGVRYTQRRYADAADQAMKAIVISKTHGFREWLGTGTLLLLMSQCALNPSLEAVQQATAVCESFASEGVGLNASYYLWGLARGYARLGAMDAARKTLDKAFEVADASAETRMNPELLILRAELEPDNQIALKHLAGALSLAEKQGAVATALRAAATILSREEGDRADPHASSTLLDLLDCRVPYPEDATWMRSGLERLRHALAPASQGPRSIAT